MSNRELAQENLRLLKFIGEQSHKVVEASGLSTKAKNYIKAELTIAQYMMAKALNRIEREVQ